MEYRTKDCEDWAKDKLKELSRKGRAVLLRIEPKPPARFIAGVKMPPNGQMVWPHPPWAHHVAVLQNGRAYDEAYPNGLPLAEYRRRFEHHDVLIFRELG